MKPFEKHEFWFVTGSQHLYGPQVLDEVATHANIIARALDAALPARIVCKGLVTTPDEASSCIKEANYDSRCAGIITWMHTFSPSKMWINGLKILNKPLLHLHTQFNAEIPVNDIDMDFMNSNQSAHGDREHGFIGARLRLPRKIVAGHWQDDSVLEKIGAWIRSAIGCTEGSSLKVARFGDNMREVAVTEGDKVEAQIKLGWAVNTYGVGGFAEQVRAVPEAEVDALYGECREKYDIATDNEESVRYQLRMEAAFKKFFIENGIGAFTTTFEDLWGLEQLPGLASQRLMEAGYGFGGEGDWKTAALLRVMKTMGKGLPGGTTFMEDYTYHLIKGDELVLGAHMLEVCPSIAAGKVRIESMPLGIGGKADPARMVFEGHAGKAVCASLIDMGGRMRLVCADVEAVEPIHAMPKLPVARVMWRLLPDFETGARGWITAGGAHHSVLSYTVTADMLEDYAEMADIEFIHIGAHTDIHSLKRDLLLADIAWKLR